jgi:suppressor of ftsI
MDTPASNQGSQKHRLVVGLFISFAVILFGLIWLFFFAPSNPSGFGWYLFSFATGISMIVLPCTLPLAFVIVPLSMGKGVVKGFSIAVAFGLGVAITLSLYGVVAAIVGKFAIGSLGAPLEVIKNYVYFIAGIFAYLFALGEVGLIKFRMPTYSGAAPAVIQKQGDVVKALLLGLFLGNIGVGCPHPATPLILVEIATSGNVFYGWSLFFIHALGRILPLLFLALLGIIGVNGLSWLVARKDRVERATGWAMVFVGAFILVLGLFSHDWWVNSGIHTQFEKVTQEQTFLSLINTQLGTETIHSHGVQMGTGLFGLPLSLGNWVLIILWLVPMWWWYRKRKKEAVTIPEENTVPEKSALMQMLTVKKYLFITLALLFGIVFIYALPHNFLQHESQTGGHDEHMTVVEGTAFSQAPEGPPASPTEVVYLKDGDTFDLTAMIVTKKVGNREVKMLAYNGSVPGPIIKVDQGSEITINFTNNTDIETTIHSHGIRVDNRFDGVPFSTQDPVGIGGRFQYKIKFPDAGIYWYHPHIREDYAQEHGLYGNYIVESADEDYWSDVNREVPMIIDDIKLADGLIESFYEEYTNYALLGRFGNEYLVNGEVGKVFDVKVGEVLRIPITNVANVRTFKLSVPGAKMKLVAADLSKFEYETFVDDFLISPAERVVVEIYFEKAGQYELTHTMPNGVEEIATFNVVVDQDQSPKLYSKEFFTLRENADVALELSGLREYTDRPADKAMLLTVEIGEVEIDHSEHGHDGGASESTDDHHGDSNATDHSQHAHSTGATGEDAIQWDDKTGDAMSTSDNIVWKIIDRDTGAENMGIDWKFKVGDLVKISIENDMEAEHVMQHPIHFHGQRFVILSTNDVPNKNMAWKDTVLVAPGERVDVLVEMSNPGVWMSHCHIAEHLHSGMMMGFRVEESDGSAPGDAYRATVSSMRMDTAGLHAMSDGTIMNAKGEIVKDAVLLPDGTIQLGDGHSDDGHDNSYGHYDNPSDQHDNSDGHHDASSSGDDGHDNSDGHHDDTSSAGAVPSKPVLVGISIIVMTLLGFGVYKFINVKE